MRKEFSAKVKRETKARAGDLCEVCLKPHLGKFHFDHVIPDGLTGLPDAANCKLTCVPCHKEKTAKDVANIAQAKRREAVQENVVRDKHPIPQRPKALKEKRDALPLPPRRDIFDRTKTYG